MPELPWKKWYPQDWMSDPKLSMCSPATRGIWADALNVMMLLGTCKIEGDDAKLARLLRASEGQILVAHTELKETGTADTRIQNGTKIWESRRLARELHIKDIRRDAVNKRWYKPDTKALQDVNTNGHTTSASASVSASVSSSETVEEGECKGGELFSLDQIIEWASSPTVGMNKTMATEFFDHYNSVGWKKGVSQHVMSRRAEIESAMRQWKVREPSMHKDSIDPPKNETYEEREQRIDREMRRKR